MPWHILILMLQDMIVPGGTQRELMLVVSDTDSEQCQLYEFSVTSFNDIGESEAAVITETLPISESAPIINVITLPFTCMQGVW